MLKRLIYMAIWLIVPVPFAFFSHVTDAQMRLSDSGHGEVLIFPFYSAAPGERTELTITNHRNHAKAVTIRFREGLAGTEVLGFHIYLAPYDNFTASVVIDSEAGTAAVSTTDSTCTVPVLGSPNGDYSGTTTSSGGTVRRVQPFVPYLYLDDSNADLGRTFAGSAEVIELGQWVEGSTVRNTGVFNDIVKSADGDRDGCDALNRNWGPGGVWYNNPKASASNWMGGGLSGKLTVHSPAGEMRLSPLAIDGFARTSTTAEYHQSPGEAEGAWPSASLMNGSREVLSPADGSLITARSGLDAIAILLTKTEVTALAAKTYPNSQRGVILSFPTKWHHSTARLGTGALSPFTKKWDSQTSQACELVAAFDQAGPTAAFPYPADAQTLEVCSAVAVLSATDAADQDSQCSFGSISCFDSSDSSEVGSNLILPTYAEWLGQFAPETGQYPWRLSFGSSDFMSQSSERWFGGSTQFKGLPAVVIPFAIEEGGGSQIGGQIRVTGVSEAIVYQAQGTDSAEVSSSTGGSTTASTGGTSPVDDGSNTNDSGTSTEDSAYGGSDGDVGDGQTGSGTIGGGTSGTIGGVTSGTSGTSGNSTSGTSGNSTSGTGGGSSGIGTGGGSSGDGTGDGSISGGETAADAGHFSELLLELPAQGGVYTGISRIQGWAVDDQGRLGSEIAIYVDGVYSGQIAYGDTRLDVGSAYSGVRNSGSSGFAAAFNFSALEPGWHEITVLTKDSTGRSLRASARFQVVKFGLGSYLTGADAPRIVGNSCRASGNDIVCTAVVGGSRQSVRFSWSSATQSFEVVDIN